MRINAVNLNPRHNNHFFAASHDDEASALPDFDGRAGFPACFALLDFSVCHNFRSVFMEGDLRFAERNVRGFAAAQVGQLEAQRFVAPELAFVFQARRAMLRRRDPKAFGRAPTAHRFGLLFDFIKRRNFGPRRARMGEFDGKIAGFSPVLSP